MVIELRIDLCLMYFIVIMLAADLAYDWISVKDLFFLESMSPYYIHLDFESYLV